MSCSVSNTHCNGSVLHSVHCMQASHQFQSSVVMCIVWCTHDPTRSRQPYYCHVPKWLQLASSYRRTRASPTRGPVLTCSDACETVSKLQSLWNMAATGLPMFSIQIHLDTAYSHCYHVNCVHPRCLLSALPIGCRDSDQSWCSAALPVLNY